jgi:hypothetical protein
LTLPLPATHSAAAERRFEARDDPSVRVFPHLPGKGVREDFLDHLSRTGCPDLWRWHLHTPPPKDGPFQIVCSFVIPERLRAGAGLAPCPICSPTRGKYYQGCLVWFEQEQALRAIGHECGHDYFAGDSWRNAERRHRLQQEDEANVGFLIDNLPLVSGFRSFVTAHSERACHADLACRALRKAITLQSVKAIHRHLLENDALVIFEERSITGIGADGRERSRTTAVAVKRLPLVGRGVLRATYPNADALFNNADLRLAQFDVAHDDDGWVAQVQQLGPEGRADAASLIREAHQLLTEALQWMAEVASFLAPENLASLLEWGRDHRSSVGLRGTVGSTLQIGPWEGKRVTVRLLSHVTEPPPTVAPLIEQTMARSHNRSDGHEDEEG